MSQAEEKPHLGKIVVDNLVLRENPTATIHYAINHHVDNFKTNRLGSGRIRSVFSSARRGMLVVITNSERTITTIRLHEAGGRGLIGKCLSSEDISPEEEQKPLESMGMSSWADGAFA